MNYSIPDMLTVTRLYFINLTLHKFFIELTEVTSCKYTIYDVNPHKIYLAIKIYVCTLKDIIGR